MHIQPILWNSWNENFKILRLEYVPMDKKHLGFTFHRGSDSGYN